MNYNASRMLTKEACNSVHNYLLKLVSKCVIIQHLLVEQRNGRPIRPVQILPRLPSLLLVSSQLRQMVQLSKKRFVLRIITGSDRRPETKQGKIVRFRSCLRHFRFIISCRRHFFQFVVNFIHVIPKKE